jgi:hypothetical protein
MKKLGSRHWAISCGHLPLHSTGEEPDHTSRDELCILNANDQPAQLQLMIYYVDRDPVGPYAVSVHAARVKHVRFNDLIDPQAIELDTPFACIVEADVPVVVQFMRVDTSRAANAIACTSAVSG